MDKENAATPRGRRHWDFSRSRSGNRRRNLAVPCSAPARRLAEPGRRQLDLALPAKLEILEHDAPLHLGDRRRVADTQPPYVSFTSSAKLRRNLRRELKVFSYGGSSSKNGKAQDKGPLSLHHFPRTLSVDLCFAARWNSTIKARIVHCGSKSQISPGMPNGCFAAAQVLNEDQKRPQKADHCQIRILRL